MWLHWTKVEDQPRLGHVLQLQLSPPPPSGCRKSGKEVPQSSLSSGAGAMFSGVGVRLKVGG